jgi:hypothetical protein
MKDFKKQQVWQKSHQLTMGIFNDADFENLSKETVAVKKMLTSFIKKLKAES